MKEKSEFEKEEYELIRKDPYEYIQNYADMNIKIVGRQVYRKLALLPHTLFLPDISSSVIANMSGLILGESGSGKSSACKIFAPLCHEPLVRRMITEADLIEVANELRFLSIIIEDLSQSVTNEGYGLIKVIEGLVGEEKSVSKSTMKKEYTEEVKAVGLFGITPQDLERFAKDLETGLFSRCILILISLKKEDYKTIAEFQVFKSGDLEYQELLRKKAKIVIDFYEELRMIQRGRHHDFLVGKFGEKHGKEVIEPIKGYHIEDRFKIEFLKKWNRISENLLKQGRTPNNRELQVYSKFLVSSAFLNIHKRKHENGILYPNEEDHKLALSLTIENMQIKWAIPLALKYNKKATNRETLEKILNDGLPEAVKEVLINISPYGKYLKD
jgi:hypothetical protein